MIYKGDTTLSFRFRVSKEQFPLDSGQMSLTQRCTSSQYHANIPVESIPGIPRHTRQNEFKSKRNSPTSLTVNKIRNWKCEGWHEQTTKPSKKLATKTPWAATWNPRTQKAFTPSAPMELPDRLMLVTEVFVIKASASAWPKGKWHGSRSRLTSVRPHEIQRRHNSQFQTPSFQRTIPTGSRIQGKCLWHRDALPANVMPISQKAYQAYHIIPDRMSSSQTESHPLHWQSTRFETGNAKDEHQQTTKPSKKLATKTPWAATWNPGTQKAFTPSAPDGIARQVDACHGSVRHQSFS